MNLASTEYSLIEAPKSLEQHQPSAMEVVRSRGSRHASRVAKPELQAAIYHVTALGVVHCPFAPLPEQSRGFIPGQVDCAANRYSCS